MSSLKKEILEKLSTLITAAFGLVAALAWNAAIQGAFDEYVKSRFGVDSQLQIMFLYATLITVVAVLATIWIGRSVAKVGEFRFPRTWAREMRGSEPPPPLE